MVEKIKSAIHGQHGLKSATILLVITLFLSNVLGLLRNIVLASHALSLTQLDPYYAAFRLPDLIFNILILGAISSAFIPVYTQQIKEEGQDHADRMANTLLGNLIGLVLVCISVIWILAPVLVPLLVHDFSASLQEQTVHLTRIMLLSPLFFSLSYVSGAVLNSHKRFFAYAVAPLIYNCAIIVGALLLPWYGVEGVAWSVVFGAALHFLIQVPTLLVSGFRIRPRFDLRNAIVRRIVLLTIPRTFTLVMVQVSLLGFTVIATRLHPGALAIFSLTNDFQTAPAIILGASLATAVFPILSDAVAEKSPEKYQHNLMRTLRVSLFTIIPLTVIVFLLRAQVIRLYIGLGHNISWTDTIRAINTLAWFSLSFMAQALVFIISRAFYALQDARRPMYASIIATIFTLILAVLLPLTSFFGPSTKNDVASLACAYSIGMWLQAIILLIWLPHKWKGNLSSTWKSVQWIVLLSLCAGFLTWVTLQLVGEGLHLNQLVSIEFTGIGTHTILRLLIQALAALLIGVISYVGLAKLAGLEELNWLIQFRSKLGYEKKTTEG